MSEQWFISVEGREYGPADLATLHEWKNDGRVLPNNNARQDGVGLWITAAEIPGLFDAEPVPPPVQQFPVLPEPIPTAYEEVRIIPKPVEPEPPALPPEPEPVRRKKVGKLWGPTFRVYREGFAQFFCLTLLVVFPSVCAQLTSAGLNATPNVDVDLRTALAAGFAFCMTLLGLVLWPIYIAGIQVLSAELAANRPMKFLAVLNAAVKFWPRVAVLCLFVYSVFFLLTVFGFAIALMLLIGATSLPTIAIALVLFVFQAWMFGRFFVSVLFWQQSAVLGDLGVNDSLRESKKIARSGKHLAWFRRPQWRGAFIASFWCAFVLALNWPSIWPYAEKIMTVADPDALMKSFMEITKSQEMNIATFGIAVFQKILQPLLGIAFVLLYLDAKIDSE